MRKLRAIFAREQAVKPAVSFKEARELTRAGDADQVIELLGTSPEDSAVTSITSRQWYALFTESLKAIGDTDRAVAVALEGLDRDPAHIRLRRLLAQMLEQSQRFGPALEHWEFLAERFPGEPLSLARYCRTRLRLHGLEDTREWLARYLERHSTMASLVRAAEAFAELGLWAEFDRQLLAIHNQLDGESSLHIFRVLQSKGLLSRALHFAASLPALNDRPEVRRLERSADEMRETLSLQPGAELSVPGTIVTTLLRDLTPTASDHGSGRVLIVTWKMARGGAERQVRNLILGMLADGFPPERVVLCVRGEQERDASTADAFLGDLHATGIQIERYGDRDPIQAQLSAKTDDCLKLLPSGLYRDILLLLNLFARHQPEIVHCWQDQTNILGGTAAVLHGVPRIFLSARNVAPTDNFRYSAAKAYWQDVYKALLERRNVTLLHNSAAGAATYASWLGLIQEPVIIPNGLDLTQFKVRDVDPVQPTIGGIFRFAPQKRPDLWLRTVAILARDEPGWRFIHAGSAGSLEGRVHETARELGLEQLQFRGEQSNVREVLDELTVLLLTSEIEGLPNVVLEALTCGVPVVTANAGGVSEIDCPDSMLRIVESDAPLDYANAVRSVIGARRTNEQARIVSQQIVESYSVEKMTRSHLALYGLLGD